MCLRHAGTRFGDTALRAANQSHAGADSQDTIVWTHDDLENFGASSDFRRGRIDEEGGTLALAPGPYVRTQTGVVRRKQQS